MTTYSYAQMMQLWITAASPKIGASAARATAPVAAAIGEAESGGNSGALNPNDNNGTQSSFGIWQISNGTHTPPSPNWANPEVNAQLAVGKYLGAGRSWSPWGTYDSGAYRAFLNGSTTPDPNVPGAGDQFMAQTTAAESVDCLVGNPFGGSVGFGPVHVGGTLGPSCLFSKSNARAFIGAGLLVAGGVLAFDGGMFLMAGLALRAAGAAGLPVPSNLAGGVGQFRGLLGARGSSDQAPEGATAEWVPQRLRSPRAGQPTTGPKTLTDTVVADAPLAAAA